ncbi:hypothetical protein [Phyllobacterium sp. SB3]|uniref:hypothetical protein n=1 Tax=Phyllobacterium sp. SB3 TaxID=3156073 RepID=UPI0032AF02BF
MIILIGADGQVTIGEPDDFKRFSVNVHSAESDFPATAKSAAPLVDFENVGTAWVDIEKLKAFSEFQPQKRVAELDTMVAAAAPHGWVSADGKAIKSHVKWQK